MKWGLGVIAAVLLLFNVTLYASPTLSQQIGRLIPDALVGNSNELSGHDRGCSCHLPILQEGPNTADLTE